MFIHYTLAIAVLNDIDINDAVTLKDKAVSIKYNHRNTLAMFVMNKRTDGKE